MSVPAVNPTVEKITKNNHQLFQRYAKEFQSTEQYIKHATKFADWLRDSKAYYDAARPWIVKLLLIARGTLRATLGVDESAEFYASDYSGNPMVQAYSNMIASVEPFKNFFKSEPGSSDVIVHVQDLINTLRRPHEPVIAPSQTQAVYHPIPNAVGGTSHQATATSSSSCLLAEDDPDITIIERPPNKNFPDKPVQSRPRSTASGHTPTKPTLSASRPKIKKRKTIDFNVLVNYDLKGLQEKKAVHSLSAIEGIKAKAITTETKPSTSEILLKDQALTMVTEQDSKTDIMRPMEVDQASHLVYNKEVTQDVSMTETLLEGIPRNDQQHTALSRPENSQESKNADPIAHVESKESAHAIEDPAPTSVATEPGLSMDIDIPDIFNSRPSNETSELVPPKRPTSEASCQVVNEVFHPQIRNETKRKEHSPPLPDPPKIGKFGPEMRIVTKQEGLPGNGHISIRFYMSEDQHVSVTNWVNYQSAHQSIPGRCVSITLGCYLNVELSKNAKAADSTTFEAQVSLASSTWPHEGLTMRVSFADKLETLPLSPPLQVTPDNLVDVCPFITVGHNTILLDQHQDLSQYTFVLHAHYPTIPQLMQVKRKRQEEKEWQEWVQAITKPLPFQFIPDMQTASIPPVS